MIADENAAVQKISQSVTQMFQVDYASVEGIVTDQLVRDAITNDLLTKAALPTGIFLRGCDGFVKPKSIEALRIAAN